MEYTTLQASAEGTAPEGEKNRINSGTLLEFHGPVGEILRQCRRSFYLAALLTIVIEILSISPILYMLNLFDRVMSSRSEVTLVALLILIVGIYVFWTILDGIRARLMQRISLRIDWELAAPVFDASFRRQIGQKKTNVNLLMDDLVQIRKFIDGNTLIAIFTVPFGFAFALLAWYFHHYLAIFMVATMLIMLLLTYLSRRLSSPMHKAATEASAEANRLAVQSLRNSEAAFALGMQSDIRRRWHEQHQKYMIMTLNAKESSGLVDGLTGFFNKLFPSLQMSLAIWLAIAGHITGGMVMAATMLLSKAMGPIRTILVEWKTIIEAKASFDRLNNLLEEGQWRTERMKLPAPQGFLHVNALTVTPPKAKTPVLTDISFELKAGEILVILGPSAAGKTTLIKALAGMWAPQSGMARLDGVHVSEWLRDDMGRHIGYVPQEIEFFEGTVAENIARLGAVDSDQVIHAARQVRMHHPILSFPEGYETRLGENGHPLTGGEKQRIALARALYGSPRFLLMDEPNASLDDAGQEALQNTLLELRKQGKVIVISTHRPQLIRISDKVLVLGSGRVRWHGATSEFGAKVAAMTASGKENAMPLPVVESNDSSSRD